MESLTLIHGDCREKLKGLSDASIDSVVTDPPYGLEFMKTRRGGSWKQGDANGFRRSKNPADVGRDSVFGRTSARGPEYKTGVGFQMWCEEWAREVLRVLKPGGHLLAFGGTRTYHRMACAIEDAGFEIRDQMQWLYGSGFPKSRNLDGDRLGWGTALKPANEPICVARKPLSEPTVAKNVLAHGTGAINIDGCRIELATHQQGLLGSVRRWPTNVVLDEQAAAILDEQRKCSVSRFYYVAKASHKERGEGNHHPTVKPVALMRYLCRLVTPPGGLVLDTFMGSGTTGIAAIAEGFSFIGIEHDADYLAIAEARIAEAQRKNGLDHAQGEFPLAA